MSSPPITPTLPPRTPQRSSPSVTFQLRQDPQKMSITQTFYLAHKARAKLSSEASRQDHNLRLLVAHANLLDTLMVHLSEAEEEQEQWFNNTVRGNEESREWPQPIPEVTDEYGSLPTDYDSHSETESESDDDAAIEFEQPRLSLFIPSETAIDVAEVEDDYEDFADEEELIDDSEDEDGLFSLRRTTSHRPPSLCSDLSDDDDEESNPPSPPQPTIEYLVSEKERIATAARSFYDVHHSASPSIHHETHDLVMGEHYFLPERPATVISTY